VYDLLTGMKKVGLSTTKQSCLANAHLVKHGILITIIMNIHNNAPFNLLSLEVSAGIMEGVFMKLRMGANNDPCLWTILIAYRRPNTGDTRR
jgi:hypothetical protein